MTQDKNTVVCPVCGYRHTEEETNQMDWFGWNNCHKCRKSFYVDITIKYFNTYQKREMEKNFGQKFEEAAQHE